MKIARDDPRIAASGLLNVEDQVLIGTPLLRFVIPGRGGTCDVLIGADGQLDLQPERSSAHKALCAVLGLS